MDSVQICFICLDAIYHGYILLYSSYKKGKKKNYHVTCSHFPLGKIGADALLKPSTDSTKTGYIPLVPL